MKNLLSFIFILLGSFSFFINSHAQNVYQAEDAQVINNGAIETDHLGYTGTGYVNGGNAAGPYIEWAISMAAAGDQTLSIFYAHGKTDDRSMSLKVNGTDISTLSFPGTGLWTTYSKINITAALKEGLNIIRITSSTSNGGPNIDKLEVSGTKGAAFSSLNTTKIGDGTISISPDQDYFIIGSQVTLTAHPADTFFFAAWKGNVDSKDSSVTITIDSINNMTALFMRYNKIIRTTEKKGWCDYNAETTGGEGGDVIIVNSQSTLASAVSGSSAKIIKIEGNIILAPVGTEISVGSNKTIMGIDETSMLIGGGFRVQDANNVIIKDLTFKDAYVDWEGKTTDNDALEINNSTHVWITHCDFSHFDDGLCDIKNGSDYVTVSWCHFHNHNKVMLIGSADNSPQDVGHLNVTLHHNWFDGRFDNGVGQRLPMARYGMVHVFNNYYTDIITRGAEANFEVNMVCDNNYFLNTAMPHVLVGGVGSNKISASGNVYVNSGSRRDNSRNAFNPSDYYTYSYSNAMDVPVFVMLGAGVFADSLLGRIDSVFISSPDTTAALSYKTIKDKTHKLNCFPNPSNKILFVNFISNPAETVRISIIDLGGREVYFNETENLSQEENTLKLDVSTFSPGPYILRLSTESEVTSKKIIIR